MIYTIFHLSDLHFRSGWEEENDLVCGYLLKDIASQAKGLESPIIAFTGDVVFSADDPDGYKKFSERFIPALDNAGLHKSRRIVIPGNHDAQRSAIKSKLTLQNGAVSAVINERGFNDNLAELAKQYFSSKFEKYQEFEKSFAEHPCCASALGGIGFELPGNVGIFCLNTAMATSAGLEDQDGNKINDKGKLPVATRLLHQWVSTTDYKTRILLAHHPFDWLTNWANEELQRTVNSEFHLVLTGHVHTSDSFQITRAVRQTVYCAAPALFTRKSQQLGYCIITVDTDGRAISAKYRQWVNDHRRFVAGSIFTGTDDGIVSYSFRTPEERLQMNNVAPIPVKPALAETIALLEAEYLSALHNYSSKPLMWVERDLASVPETDRANPSVKMQTPLQLAGSPRDCVIRAPREFGLTCVGKKIAFEFHRASEMKEVCLYIDRAGIDIYKKAVEDYIATRLQEIKAEGKRIANFVIDNWQRDKKGRKLIELLRELHPGTTIILLERTDPLTDLERAFDDPSFSHGEHWYLWSLTQNRVRNLVEQYVKDIRTLDPEIVTRKIIKDIETLNIFRTPHNCLMFLRLAEQAFDDSPVNRTELIHRVLFLLFYRFNEIPTYASRPDLKDCEYVLGNFCEWLIRQSKSIFTKNEFFSKGITYCEDNLIALDVDVLFGFLLSTRILVSNGSGFQFRFIYWHYYFAAHRMHHSQQFASFILSDARYASMPEVVEFYTGIDRRRADAVQIIAKDLEEMASKVAENTHIPVDFEPFAHAKWKPSQGDISDMKADIQKSIVNSTLPADVRDSFADQQYNWSRPYSQEVAAFVDQASLRKMFQATKGAARALRNSDHVPPADKIALFNAVMMSWNRVAQVLAVISPILAAHNQATCEGMSFILTGDFGPKEDPVTRWLKVLSALPFNIVNWFEDDLYSTKLNPLLNKYIGSNAGGLTRVMLLMILIRRRPEGWAREVKRFMLASPADSIELFQIFNELRQVKQLEFISEADEEQLNHLSQLALAKHELNAGDPNRDQLRKAAQALGDPLPPSSSELRHQEPKERNRKS